MSRTDQFAELLSQDMPMPEIARRMKLTRGQAAGIFRRIRLSLGDQAQ